MTRSRILNERNLRIGYRRLRKELSKYKRALKVAKERITRHWSGNSEDTCVEIANILNED